MSTVIASKLMKLERECVTAADREGKLLLVYQKVLTFSVSSQ